MSARSGWGGWLLLAVAVGCDARDATGSTASAEPSQGASGAMSSSPVVDAEQAAIKQVFLDYRTAAVAKRGDDAAKVVASRTLDYYESIRKSALSLPEAELRKKPVNDRFMILLVRAQVDATALRKMDGRALFAHTIDRGMIGDGTRSLEPDGVEIRGEEASLGMFSRGTVVPPEKGFRLYREGGTWKLDVLSVMGTTKPSTEEMLTKIDPDVDLAMVKLAEQVAGRPLAKTIWLAPDAPP